MGRWAVMLGWTLVMLVGPALHQPALHRAVWTVSIAAVVAEWVFESCPSSLVVQVSNALIKKELGVRLQFPTYREGLAAIAEGDMRPFN